MDKIAIVHFQPLEKYPPVMNIINNISELENTYCTIYSTNNYRNKNWFSVDKIFINRIGGALKDNSISRYWCYIKFNVFTFFSLLIKNPNVVIGFETYSVLPIILYKKLFSKTKVHIHYHEYTSLQEIKKSSLYFKGLHTLEKKLFSNCESISHTNEDRMQLFLKDYPFINKSKGIIAPNLPPSNWYDFAKSKKKENTTGIVRLVHVGALSLDTMYVKEIVEWVISQKGLFTLDFYSSNCPENSRKFIENLQNNNIKLFNSINYFELPKTLINYDIGITLYNGFSPNHVYSVPNKVIEYLACGIKVWYSKDLINKRKFIDEYKMLGCSSVDFNNLTNLKIDSDLKLNFFNRNDSLELFLNNSNNYLIKLIS